MKQNCGFGSALPPGHIIPGA